MSLPSRTVVYVSASDRQGGTLFSNPCKTYLGNLFWMGVSVTHVSNDLVRVSAGGAGVSSFVSEGTKSIKASCSSSSATFGFFSSPSDGHSVFYPRFSDTTISGLKKLFVNFILPF